MPPFQKSGVFISYARADGEQQALNLRQRLEAAGHSAVAGPRGHGRRQGLVAANHGGARCGRVHGPGDDAGRDEFSPGAQGMALCAPARSVRLSGEGRRPRFQCVAALDAKPALLRPRASSGRNFSTTSGPAASNGGSLSWPTICRRTSSRVPWSSSDSFRSSSIASATSQSPLRLRCAPQAAMERPCSRARCATTRTSRTRSTTGFSG